MTKDTVSIFECWNENLKEIFIAISGSSLEELQKMFAENTPEVINHWDVNKHSISCQVVEKNISEADATIFAKAYTQSRSSRGYRFVVANIDS
ncbi:MAG: hypothetical protein COB53_08270 [Elusimicrobia bacterium]|nr:MAG: hypothetical protein COB53_08270 [Elusimicrobiota bacterium]